MLICCFYINMLYPSYLPLVKLLYPLRSLVDSPVNRRCDGEGTSNNGADTHQERGEAFTPRFAIDDLHWRNILMTMSIQQR